jgi:hypothetical protein
MASLKRYLFNWLVVADLAINTLLAGSPYETISERCWRHRDTRAGAMAVKLLTGYLTFLGKRTIARTQMKVTKPVNEIKT